MTIIVNLKFHSHRKVAITGILNMRVEDL
jgi:hypothetical protein